MCNDQKRSPFTRGDIQRAFGLPSSEMTNGEFMSLSRQLENQLAAKAAGSLGETTRGSYLKQDSGGLGLVGR